jgi:hypothetical protein
LISSAVINKVINRGCSKISDFGTGPMNLFDNPAGYLAGKDVEE